METVHFNLKRSVFFWQPVQQNSIIKAEDIFERKPHYRVIIMMRTYVLLLVQTIYHRNIEHSRTDCMKMYGHCFLGHNLTYRTFLFILPRFPSACSSVFLYFWIVVLHFQKSKIMLAVYLPIKLKVVLYTTCIQNLKQIHALGQNLQLF